VPGGAGDGGVAVNARHVKQVPGRKTDMSDAQWLCQLTEAGLLRGSFVPPKPVGALRQLTRYRTTQVAERQREANRLHKALDVLGRAAETRARRLIGGVRPRRSGRSCELAATTQCMARRARPGLDRHLVSALSELRATADIMVDVLHAIASEPA
jgi:transposase